MPAYFSCEGLRPGDGLHFRGMAAPSGVDYVRGMLPPRICNSCEQQLTQASNAMRRHCAQMRRSIQWLRNGATDEQRQKLRIKLVSSFNDAQSAWDAYREHLIEHGFLPLS